MNCSVPEQTGLQAARALAILGEEDSAMRDHTFSISARICAGSRRSRGTLRAVMGTLAFLLGGLAVAGASAADTPQEVAVRDLYPLITTPHLTEVRDFYVSHFGLAVVFEASWFVYLSGAGEPGSRGATLAFMHPDHPSSPPGPEVFSGKGAILTLEVSDAAGLYEKLRGRVPVVHPLTDEDWGQRRFMIRDPAGVLVDVVEQISPKPGYWDPYLAQ